MKREQWVTIVKDILRSARLPIVHDPYNNRKAVGYVVDSDSGYVDFGALVSGKGDVFITNPENRVNVRWQTGTRPKQGWTKEQIAELKTVKRKKVTEAKTVLSKRFKTIYLSGNELTVVAE